MSICRDVDYSIIQVVCLYSRQLGPSNRLILNERSLSLSLSLSSSRWLCISAGKLPWPINLARTVRDWLAIIQISLNEPKRSFLTYFWLSAQAMQ